MEGKETYITVMSGLRGYYAAMIGWYEEDRMWDVVNTSMFSSKSWKEALIDALSWAKAEEIKCKLGKEDIDGIL